MNKYSRLFSKFLSSLLWPCLYNVLPSTLTESSLSPTLCHLSSPFWSLFSFRQTVGRKHLLEEISDRSDGKGSGGRRGLMALRAGPEVKRMRRMEFCATSILLINIAMAFKIARQLKSSTLPPSFRPSLPPSLLFPPSLFPLPPFSSFRPFLLVSDNVCGQKLYGIRGGCRMLPNFCSAYHFCAVL